MKASNYYELLNQLLQLHDTPEQLAPALRELCIDVIRQLDITQHGKPESNFRRVYTAEPLKAGDAVEYISPGVVRAVRKAPRMKAEKPSLGQLAAPRPWKPNPPGKRTLPNWPRVRPGRA